MSEILKNIYKKFFLNFQINTYASKITIIRRLKEYFSFLLNFHEIWENLSIESAWKNGYKTKFWKIDS